MPQETPIVVTDLDVRDPSLLVRFLRRLVDKISALADRITKVETAPKATTPAQIRDSLQATGNTPLNVNGLLGVLAQPQPASASAYSAAPTGQVLQGLQGQQLVLVGTTSTGYALNTVLGGNPNTLYQLMGGLTTGTVGSTSTNLMTIDTDQLTGVIGKKLWTNAQEFDGGIGIGQAVNPARALDIASAGALLTGTIRYWSIQTDTGGNRGLLFGQNTAGVIGVIGAAGVNGILSIVTHDGTAFAERMRINSSGYLEVSKKLASYNLDSLSSNANGVASILNRSTQPAASAPLGSTLLVPAPATGEYRATWVMQATASGTTTWAISFNYTDENGAVTVQQSPILDTSFKSRQGGVAVIRSCSTNITYSVSQVNTSTVSPLGSYNVYVLLERMS